MLNKKGLRLLIVDDEEDILEVLEYLLSDFFEFIDQASDGDQALELIKANKPDLMVCDQNMPNKTGLELIAHLKNKGIEIPTLLLSGYVSNEVYNECWRCGVYEIITKPVRAESLRASTSWALRMGPTTEGNRGMFLNRTHESVLLDIPHDKYESIIKVCNERGLSITGFFNQLIDEYVQNDAHSHKKVG